MKVKNIAFNSNYWHRAGHAHDHTFTLKLRSKDIKIHRTDLLHTFYRYLALSLQGLTQCVYVYVLNGHHRLPVLGVMWEEVVANALMLMACVFACGFVCVCV